MKELRIGIIGCGVISHRHMTIWSHIPGAKVIAAAEIDPAKLEDFGEKHCITDLYTDFRQLLARDDIDAVDVCVHNNLHTPISVEVMRAGKHCYSEKPMAGSYADAKILYDAAQIYKRKLAIQISSLYNLQTRVAKEMVNRGDLGNIYHARSVGHRRCGRPGVDIPLSPDFISKEIGGHGPLFDIGVYYLSQMLYILGMPKLESVYGAAYAGYHLNERILRGHKYEVEDLGLGIARFANGMTLDIYQSWALNMDEVGTNFIAGELGGLKLIRINGGGSELASYMAGTPRPADCGEKADLEFFGIENGMMVSKKLDCPTNMRMEAISNPKISVYNDNQVHWAAYLRDELTDEIRIDTPYIAMQTAFLSEGIFLSDKLRRSVTADEISEMSVSTAVRKQITEWGIFEYEF